MSPPLAILLHQIEQDFRDELETIWPRLQRLARALVRGTAQAEDLVSKTVVKMLEHEAQFMPGSEMMDWAGTIMRNEARAQGKRARREIEDPEEACALKLVSPDNPQAVCLAKDEISFIGLLPEPQARMLVLSMKGFSIEEIAQVEGVSTGTVKSSIWRARDRLRQFGIRPTLVE